MTNQSQQSNFEILNEERSFLDSFEFKIPKRKIWHQKSFQVGYYAEDGHITKLRIVGKNYLKDLPESIGNLVNLQFLDLRGNNLKNLPKSFENLINLQYLDLSSNIYLNKIPKFLEKHPNLLNFYLSENSLFLPSESFVCKNFHKMPKIIEFEGKRITQREFSVLIKLPHLDKSTFFSTCEGNIVKLNLGNRNIDQLPESIGVLVHLQLLDLSDNNLKKLPETFGNLINLRSLDLSGNKLSTLPESFGNLINLRSLDFSWNYISCLPKSFAKLFKFRALDISHNKLTFIPYKSKIIAPRDYYVLFSLNFPDDNSFIVNNAGHITKLIIKNKKLEILPESFGNLTHLESLYLTDNYFEKLPKSFGNLIHLKKLHLTENSLKLLPESFGNLTNLQSIDLSKNYGLSELPTSFGNLTNLEFLNLSENNLSNLPESFNNLSYLRILNLYQNKLSILSSSFGNLTNLKSLNLSSNVLEILPESICNLLKLRSLDLSYNSLKNLPESIGNLSNLQKLTIQMNPLKFLPTSLCNLSKIRIFRLDDYKLPNYEKQLYTQRKFLAFFENNSVSLKNLAERLVEDEYSLSREEMNRLMQDGGLAERSILEQEYSYDEPILKAICDRMKLSLRNNFKIFL